MTVTTNYEIQLDGVDAANLSLAVIRDLTELIVEGSSRAVRLAAEGRSTARGSAPVWLGESSDVRLLGLRHGSLVLDVTARSLEEVAPSAFPIASHTALDLLMGAIEDAVAGRRDSERLDLGMLQILVKAGALFGRGASRLRFAREGGPSIVLLGASVDQFQKLAAETPAPRIDRIVGVLDSLTISTRTGLLKLGDGAQLRCNVSARVELDELKTWLGSEIVAEGTVVFHASGRPQRIEVDYAAPASAHDQLWNRALRGESVRDVLNVSAHDHAAMLGPWPGDEDDDQVFAALRELS